MGPLDSSGFDVTVKAPGSVAEATLDEFKGKEPESMDRTLFIADTLHREKHSAGLQNGLWGRPFYRSSADRRPRQSTTLRAKATGKHCIPPCHLYRPAGGTFCITAVRDL
jgi:hypothetical protein